MNALFRPSIALACVVGLVVTLAVAGCGKKGGPERPMGSDFPRQYPNPNPNPSPSPPADPGPKP